MPRTFEHQRVHRRYHNRRSPGDVTGVGAPPCKRKRERKKEIETEKERGREMLFLPSLFPSVSSFLSSPSLFLYPREFHSSGFCGPSLSPLSHSFLAFARACRKTPNRSVTQREEAKHRREGKKSKENKVLRPSILATWIKTRGIGKIHGWTGTEG